MLKIPHLAKKFQDVDYKLNSIGEEVFLDIYLPEKPKNNNGFPVLIILHGGGWEGGDKKIESPYRKTLLRKSLVEGFAVVSANYSLIGENIQFPQPVEDCADVVRWIRKNAEQYGFDSKNIGIWGESAGAHLGMLVAFVPENKWKGATELQDFSSEINFIIDSYGPSDLNLLFQTNAGWIKTLAFKLFVSKTFQMRNRILRAISLSDIKNIPEKVKEKVKEFSPINYIEEDSTPILIIHGTRDKLAPYRQAELLEKKLKASNSDFESLTIQGGNHGFFNQSHAEISDIVEKTLTFIRDRLI